MKEYSAGTYKENGKFYPVVRLSFKAMSENYYVNEPQPTRSKALTIAKRTVKNLKPFNP